VGKSVLAGALEKKAGFAWIDTDQVRKEIAAEAGRNAEPAAFEAGMYAPEWTERTYEECLRRVRSLLFQGSRVVVEGSFRTEDHRRMFRDAVRVLGVPMVLVLCEADREIVRRRLLARAARTPGDDGSHADWNVYREMEGRWEDMGLNSAAVRRIRTDRAAEEVVGATMDILRSEGLYP
jgi:uncharacterized protein